MKFFEFWTELPSTITSMLPELDKDLVAYSMKLQSISSCISNSQIKILSQLSEVNLFDFSEDQRQALHLKLSTIESEKQEICYKSIKLTTRILSESGLILAKKQNPFCFILKRLKLFLQLTRSITIKIDEEISQNEIKLKEKENDIKKALEKINFSSTDMLNDIMEKNVENLKCLTENHSLDKERHELSKMFQCFITRLQYQLYKLSDEMVKEVDICIKVVDKNKQRRKGIRLSVKKQVAKSCKGSINSNCSTNASNTSNFPKANISFES